MTKHILHIAVAFAVTLGHDTAIVILADVIRGAAEAHAYILVHLFHG